LTRRPIPNWNADCSRTVIRDPQTPTHIEVIGAHGVISAVTRRRSGAALTSGIRRRYCEPFMVRLRRGIRRIAVTWLLCQAATLTLAPTVFAVGSTETLMACTCSHGDHAICPMHHRPAPGSKICVMTRAGDSGVVVFSWLLNMGLAPTRAEVFVLQHREISRPIDFGTPSPRSAPPDPPPPRA
jgi:hypothetical protein